MLFLSLLFICIDTYIVINGYLRNIECIYHGLRIPFGVNIICGHYYYDEIKFITQTSYNLCTMVHNFGYETVKHQNELKELIEIKGFTGNEVFDQIQNNLSLSTEQTLNVCNLLVIYGFLRLIAIRRVLAINNYNFYCNDKYLYLFDVNKQSQLLKYKKYQYSHRQKSWNINTIVNINQNINTSSIHNHWKLAKIVDIDEQNEDKLKIKLLNDNKDNQFEINRFDQEHIKSTKQYIQQRENWKNNDVINIYNHKNKIWLKGKIENIKTKNDIESYIDILQILYQYNDKTNIEYISRWSPFIQ